MNTSPPALRPYLEIIETQCRALDRENLLQLILALAKQVDSSKRNDFLANLHAELPPNDKQTSAVAKTTLPELLTEIEELHKNIRGRLLSIDDGTYWDDEYSLDNDPEPINNEQETALTDFFAEAANHFIHGEKHTAEIHYQLVFQSNRPALCQYPLSAL